MHEWLNEIVPSLADLPTPHLFGRAVQAAVLGAAVAAAYYLTQRKGRSTAAPFVATLVLLSVLIAMVTQVIGESVARAFSLAGALAIIRFRTIVDDTRDTAFVIAAVVTGMAVGAESLKVALSGLPVLMIAAVLLHFWGGNARRWPGRGTLTVKVAAGPDPSAVVAPVLARHLVEARLTSAGTAKQGSALELTYAARPKPGCTALGLVSELTATEGVVGVEWKDNGPG